MSRFFRLIPCFGLLASLSLFPVHFGCNGSEEQFPEPADPSPAFEDSLPVDGSVPIAIDHTCLSQLDAIMTEICAKYEMAPLPQFASLPTGTIDLCGERLLQNYVTAFQAGDFPEAVRVLERIMEYLRVVSQNTVRAVEFALSAQMKAVLSRPDLADEKSSCMKAIINPAIIVADRLLYTRISLVQRLVHWNAAATFEAASGYPLGVGLFCYDDRSGDLVELGPRFRTNTGLPVIETAVSGMLQALADPRRLGLGLCSCVELALNNFICEAGIPCASGGEPTPGGAIDGLVPDDLLPDDFTPIPMGDEASIPPDSSGFDDFFGTPGFDSFADSFGSLFGSSGWPSMDDINNFICGARSGNQGGGGGSGFPIIGQCTMEDLLTVMPAESNPTDGLLQCLRNLPPESTSPGVGGFDDGRIGNLADPSCALLAGSGNYTSGWCNPYTNECDDIGDMANDTQDQLSNPSEIAWLREQCTVGGITPCTTASIVEALADALLGLANAEISYDLLANTGACAIAGPLGIVIDASCLDNPQVGPHEVRHQALSWLGVPSQGQSNSLDPQSGGHHAVIYFREIGEYCQGTDRASSRCGNTIVGFCRAAPDNQRCENTRRTCQTDSSAPECSGMNEDCQRHPNLPGCPTQENCQQDPRPPGCPPTQEECTGSNPPDTCPTSEQCQGENPPPNCPSSSSSGMPDPEGGLDQCSAEAERFNAVYECMVGPTEGELTPPPQPEPECTIEGPCEDSGDPLSCLGDQPSGDPAPIDCNFGDFDCGMFESPGAPAPTCFDLDCPEGCEPRIDCAGCVCEGEPEFE